MPTESRPFGRELLRAVLGAREAADRDLLDRFVRLRDQDAFAELVRRHGRMVLAVGRRVTGHPQDAEDAFQAAFLVLARRAGQLNRPDQLANWLYGVAYRTALEARAARRRVWERPMSPLPEPIASSPPDDTGDLRRLIDDEAGETPGQVSLGGRPVRSGRRVADRSGIAIENPGGHALQSACLRTKAARHQTDASRHQFQCRHGGRGPRSRSHRQHRAARTRSAHGPGRHQPDFGAVPPPDLVSPFVSSLTDGVMKTMLVNRLRLTLGILLASGLLGVSAYGIAQVASSTTASSQDPVLAQNAVPADPFFGQNVVEEQKQEKIAAKGIEDEDVPLASSPAQAVVRVEGDKLIVRQRGAQHQTVVITRRPGHYHNHRSQIRHSRHHTRCGGCGRIRHEGEPASDEGVEGQDEERCPRPDRLRRQVTQSARARSTRMTRSSSCCQPPPMARSSGE